MFLFFSKSALGVIEIVEVHLLRSRTISKQMELVSRLDKFRRLSAHSGVAVDFRTSKGFQTIQVGGDPPSPG